MLKTNFSYLYVVSFLTAIVFSCSSIQDKQSSASRGEKRNINPVVAHRGAWKHKKLPQNSIASLKEAISLKCGGSEFDVHLTADDVLVVNHDHVFYGLDIEKSTYDQLKAKKLPNGETISTAEEYLKEGLKQKDTKLMFELKASRLSKARTLVAAEKSALLVSKLDRNSVVEFISFDYDALKKIKETKPDAKVASLDGNTTPERVKNDGLTGVDYHISFYKKFSSWIKDAHKMNLSVNVWTVNKTEDMVYFIDEGAEYITTDFPEQLLEIWNSKKEDSKK